MKTPPFLHDLIRFQFPHRSLLFFALIIAWALPSPAIAAETLTLPLSVQRTIAHDPESFTQGLVYRDGLLFESTGRYGQSKVRILDAKTGEKLREIKLRSNQFGEGLTLWNSHLVQLTWQAGIAHIYNASTLKRLSSFQYSGQGWGLTADANRLIMSDGSDQLRFFDPDTWQQVNEVSVIAPDGPLNLLNELEMVEDLVWANIWKTNRIARIDPHTGRVIDIIDLSNLWPAKQRSATAGVMNGIAYDPQAREVYITGKLWPNIFVLR